MSGREALSTGEAINMGDEARGEAAGRRRAPGKPRGLASPNPDRARCKAHKKNGDQCKNAPLTAQTTCRFHGGGTKAARQKAQERIIGASDLAAKRLMEFMNNKRVPWSVRLAATNSLLDRAGIVQAQILKVGVASPWDDMLSALLDGGVLEDAPPEPPRAVRAGPTLAQIEAAQADADADNRDQRDEPDDPHSRTIKGEVVSRAITTGASGWGDDDDILTPPERRGRQDRPGVSRDGRVKPRSDPDAPPAYADPDNEHGKSRGWGDYERGKVSWSR